LTKIGKNETIVTTTTLVAIPRPVNSMISGATAATGAVRNASNNGVIACSASRETVNSIAAPAANRLLTTSPSEAAPSVVPVCRSNTCQCRTALCQTASGGGTR
jgi:hypothetical protein